MLECTIFSSLYFVPIYYICQLIGGNFSLSAAHLKQNFADAVQHVAVGCVQLGFE